MIFSIIVPFLNEEPYIQRSVESLIRQDFDPREYEIIFVDNGSTDRSAEILKTYPPVRLLHEGIKNVYAARNRGLKAAKGEIIAFTDADCEAAPNWLTVIHESLKEASILVGNRKFPSNASYFLKLFQDYENRKIQYILDHLPSKYFYGFTNNMAVRSDVFEALGPFPLHLTVSGDADLIHRRLNQDPNTVVRFEPKMEIRHLEITSVLSWLKKLHLYTEHNKKLEKEWDYSRLPLKEKIQAYRWCVHKEKYSPFKSFLLFLMLVIGFIFGCSADMKSRNKG